MKEENLIGKFAWLLPTFITLILGLWFFKFKFQTFEAFLILFFWFILPGLIISICYKFTTKKFKLIIIAGAIIGFLATGGIFTQIASSTINEKFLAYPLYVFIYFQEIFWNLFGLELNPGSGEGMFYAIASLPAYTIFFTILTFLVIKLFEWKKK